MPKSKLYEATLGDTIKERLAALEDKPKPPLKVPASTVIASFKREARRALERGYTLEEILQIAQEAGLEVGMSTLKTYLRERPKKPAKRSQEPRGKEAERPATEAASPAERQPTAPPESGAGDQQSHAGFSDEY